MSDSVISIVMYKLIFLCEYFNFNLHPSHYDVYSSFLLAFICSESDYSSNTMPTSPPRYLESNQTQLWFRWDFRCPHHLLRRDSQLETLLLNSVQLTILPLGSDHKYHNLGF